MTTPSTQRLRLSGMIKDMVLRDNFKRIIEAVNRLIEDKARELADPGDAFEITNATDKTFNGGTILTFDEDGALRESSATREDYGPAFVCRDLVAPGQKFIPRMTGVEELATDGGTGFTDGAPVYLSATVAGAITATIPDSGNYKFEVGLATGPPRPDGRVPVVLISTLWRPKWIQ